MERIGEGEGVDQGLVMPSVYVLVKRGSVPPDKPSFRGREGGGEREPDQDVDLAGVSSGRGMG